MKCQTEKNHDGQVRVRWNCPLCQESFGFHLHDIEVMDFLVVHHLSRKHNQDPVEILAYEADLQAAVDEYMAVVLDGGERPETLNPDRHREE
jgi:hypothetical protein